MAKIDVNRAIHRARSATLVFAVAVLATLTFTANASQALAKRVALVIGNSAYENASTLANPANDATDMAAALRDLNFEVVVGTDLDNRGMRDTVREFGKALRGADVAMVFYAGHAMQVNGKNYLAPVDTRLEYESDLDFETIPLSFIQRQMEREAKTILLFLDACRDNPLTRSFKQASRSQGAGDGLAEEKLNSSGILIAFATNPDNVALDGKGRNSPFTKAMLDNIKRPGIEISTLMTDVRVQVVNDTDGAQTPWINSALLGRFYFNPPAENATPAKAVEGESTTPTVSNNNSSAGVDNARIAALAWDSVKESKSVTELEAYKSLYGSTFYGTLADIRIKNLKAEQEKSAPAATAEKAPEAGNDAPAKEIEVASLQQEKDTEESRKLEPARDPREVARDIQSALAAFNCNPGRPDGIWGRRSQRALDAFVRASGVKLASVNPDEAMLRQLQDHDGAACPKPAVVKQKTCPAGQRLSRKGNCFTPRQQANVQPQPQPQQTRAINRQPQPQPQQQVIIQQQPQPQPQPHQQVIIQQPQPHQQVIVQPQPQPHVVQQPRQPGLLPAIGGAIGGAILGCIVGAC